MSTRHVIVGSGAAALAAAEAIRATEAVGRITMISAESAPFYSRPGLAYLLTGEIPQDRLVIRTRREWDALRVARLAGRAVRVDLRERFVELESEERVPYDRLLIATGAASVPVGFPGEALDGVVRLDGLDEAQDIVQRSASAKAAVVIGGGSTALELVDGLRARGLATHYLMRGDRYWSKVLDPVESAMVESHLVRHGVTLHRLSAVRRAIGHDGRLAAVELTSGEQIACDMLAVAVGIRPRLELAQTTGLTTDRGIVVNEFLETSAPDVFAAGDVAQVFDPLTGDSLLDTLWDSALSQGRTAGRNMCGHRVPHRKRIPMNVTRVGGITTTIIGAVGGAADDPDLLTLTRGQSERWARDPEAWVVSGARVADRLRVVVSGRVIVGAVVMGDQRVSHALAHLVGEEVDISPLRPALTTDPERAMDLLLDFCEAHVGDDAAQHG